LPDHRGGGHGDGWQHPVPGTVSGGEHVHAEHTGDDREQ
jgi:hypothetical protein